MPKFFHRDLFGQPICQERPGSKTKADMDWLGGVEILEMSKAKSCFELTQNFRLPFIRIPATILCKGSQIWPPEKPGNPWGAQCQWEALAASGTIGTTGRAHRRKSKNEEFSVVNHLLFQGRQGPGMWMCSSLYTKKWWCWGSSRQPVLAQSLVIPEGAKQYPAANRELQWENLQRAWEHTWHTW